MPEAHTEEISTDEYEKLVKRYQDLLFSYVLSLGADSFSAADIVQESFVSAYRNMGALKAKEAFYPWLRMICYRIFLKNKEQNRENRHIEYCEAICVSESSHPPVQFERAEIQRQIDKALSTLDKENREIFLLFHLCGNSQKDISSALGLTVDVVKKRLERCRKRLRKDLVFMVQDYWGAALPSKDTNFMKKINLSLSFNKAAWFGELCLIEAMLVDGIDVNEQDIAGRTLLHLAAGEGNEEAVRLLLRWKADPAIRDKEGNRAAHYARRRGFDGIKALLDEAGNGK